MVCKALRHSEPSSLVYYKMQGLFSHYPSKKWGKKKGSDADAQSVVVKVKKSGGKLIIRAGRETHRLFCLKTSNENASFLILLLKYQFSLTNLKNTHLGVLSIIRKSWDGDGGQEDGKTNRRDSICPYFSGLISFKLQREGRQHWVPPALGTSG